VSVFVYVRARAHLCVYEFLCLARARVCVCELDVHTRVCVHKRVCERVCAHTTRMRIGEPASVPACMCVGGWVSMHVNASSNERERVCVCACVCVCVNLNTPDGR